MYNNKAQWGFSLTELSIAMAIIAMIAGGAISLAISGDSYAKKQQTNLKLAAIEKALTGFVSVNKRLPCPSDGETSITDVNFGVEKLDDSFDPAICNITLATGSDFNSGNIISGVIPVTTLQLPDDFMFDGWGNRFTYVVDMRFINNKLTNDSTIDDDCIGGTCFIDTDDGDITINDGNGAIITNSAIYVIISHGENGHGAFTKNGSATRINYYKTDTRFSDVDSDELENSHLALDSSNTSYNNIFVSKPYIKNVGNSYFDDILTFKTKLNIIKDSGVNYYDSDCRAAANIVDNIGNETGNACFNAENQTMCENFAEEINSRCLNDD